MLSNGFAPIEQYDKRAKRGAYTDVYALAATLYCVLTAEVPTLTPLRAIGTPLEEPKQINSSISDRVNQAILKGMEVKAENRPQSMHEWLTLLSIPSANINLPLTITPSSAPPIPAQIDDIIRLFNSHVDYQSLNAGMLIYDQDSALHYHITISDTHAFNFGANGFAVFPIPSNSEKARHVKLLSREEVLDRCLIAYQLFKDWNYGILGWNCEHFARLVTTDTAISYQVKESPLAFLNHNGYHPLAKEMMEKACQKAVIHS